MAEIRIIVRPAVWEPLRELLEGAMAGAQAQPGKAVPGEQPCDEDLLEAWRNGLVASLREDIAVLRRLLEHGEPQGHEVVLSEDEALGLLRAASAVRLELRERFLKMIPEGALEEGDVDFTVLPPETQQAYLAYGFLAYLQEYLIVGMDRDAE